MKKLDKPPRTSTHQSQMDEFLWRISSDKDTETFNAWVNELFLRINTTSVVYVNNNQILLEDFIILLLL